GAINWFDGRAAAKVDPEGPQFPIPKGDVIDAESGEYTGVNETAKSLSSGEYDRIKLHSFFEYPHTSCGCFEVVGFYIPEVDGIGWVDRDFNESAPNGLPFSTMAGQTGGGKQIVGFLGIGINYFRSPKFIQSDGGWERVVWMPKHLKDRVIDDIPDDIKDKIATEEDVSDLETLRNFLEEKNHPIVNRWEKEEEEEAAEEEETPQQAAPAMQMPASMPMNMPAMSTSGSGGVKVILKNAKVSVDKIIIKKNE
ncbi:MAG: CO dehydrogenase/CO-methylating acetyl-CoA synthase complex subunit beta, partial [Methanohalophilus sp.]